MATGASVSSLVGLVAASLPAGTRAVVPDIEFTSNLFPLMVQPGVEVVTVPPARLAEAIDETIDVAAFSVVQMSTGEVADVDAILAAAAAHDVITLADASQAAGWLPLDATRFDYLLAVGYKWLISPRGTAWMAVAPERLDALVPAGASWFATGEPYDAFIGPPLRLADDARRLDGSPAWFSWVGSRAGARAARGGGDRGDPRARRRAGEPLPRGDGDGAGQLGDRDPARRCRGRCARRASRPPSRPATS